MLKNFSSPNLFLKKSLKSTVLLGDAGCLLGLKIVSVKLKILGFTFFVIKFLSFILVTKSDSVCKDFYEPGVFKDFYEPGVGVYADYIEPGVGVNADFYEPGVFFFCE